MGQRPARLRKRRRQVGRLASARFARRTERGPGRCAVDARRAAGRGPGPGAAGSREEQALSGHHVERGRGA
ncbi:hypothetical protein G6F32_017229 [Rhizopus arrhizus]|nr:hypothetical protein G6F32_017229 [Rhizopus arrhizus]